MTKPSVRLLALPPHAAEDTVDVARATAAISAAFRKIEIALSPVIGRRGVNALFARSRHVVAPTHPWLCDVVAASEATMDLPSLELLLLAQSGANAAAGGGALLDAFYETLVSLVGASLTKRLLSSVFTTSEDPNATGGVSQ
jgi:hypothetical protein